MSLLRQGWCAFVTSLVVALAGCATSDRVIRSVGAFGNPYTLVVQRPYVYGGGEFCGSRLTSEDRDAVWYDVFTRATEVECAALEREFVASSDSRDPFPGREVLNCRMTDPYSCERVIKVLEELGSRFATSGADGVGASAEDAADLQEFFASHGRLITRVVFGFDPSRPLSLECAIVTRQLDPEGHGTVDAIICRDAARSWIVDAYITEA
jgi:hypothetical protein